MSYDMYPGEIDHVNDDFLNDSELLNLKKADRGFNKIFRKVQRESNDKIIFKKIELYTTGGTAGGLTFNYTSMSLQSVIPNRGPTGGS